MTAKQVTKQAGRVTTVGDELADFGFKMRVGGFQRLLRYAGCIIKILATIDGDVIQNEYGKRYRN